MCMVDRKQVKGNVSFDVWLKRISRKLLSLGSENHYDVDGAVYSRGFRGAKIVEIIQLANRQDRLHITFFKS